MNRDELVSRITTELFVEFPRWMRRISSLIKGGHGDLTRVEMEILMWLKKRGPVSLSELSVLTNVKKPNLSNVVYRLESAGLIRRVEGEGRSQLLEITVEGENTMCRSRDYVKELFVRSLSKLSDTELEDLLMLLGKFEEILSSLSDEQVTKEA
ncbi:MarR family transcriptional regulator [Coprothermobacteraceae bacterium]|nr:MarR family transcriptional regulator [Coprothermobacteraceae bacterium]